MKVVERQKGINELGNCASFSYRPHHISSEHSSPLPQATPLSARCKLKNPYRQSVKSTTSLESQRTKQSKLGQILIERNLLMQGAYCLRPDASCALNLNHEPNAITHLSMIWAFLMLDHQLCQLNLSSAQMHQSRPKDW